MARRKTARPGGSNGSCRDGDGLLDVVVVILEGGYTSTAVAPIEIFHSAGVVWNWLHGEATKPRFRVRTASVDGRSVKSVCALGLTPDCALSVIKKADIIIVPASGWDAIDLIAKNTPLLPWLKKWHDRGAYIAGVCTGVAFLAECGMLDGKRATTHWGLADILGERYPKVRWQPEQFVTEDGRLFCSGGVYTAIDLSLYLVEKFCGHEIALQCAKSLLLSMPRGPAVWIFSRTIVASAFRREDQTKRRNTCSNISTATFRSTFSPGRQEWARAISSAVSRQRPAACRALTSRHSESRPQRKCSNTASRRFRPSARKSVTTISGSSAICSSVTPA